MLAPIEILSRSNIDTTAWDACVQASPQRIVYGYSWYLDAVLPEPGWKWIGLVQPNNSGQYVAVMPVPLRRRGIAGVYQKWVVHQPFFCQFLGVFSRDGAVDVRQFFDVLIKHFQYGSIYSTCTLPIIADLSGAHLMQTTHVLDLAVKYEVLYQNYTHDRKENLRRGKKNNWRIVDSNKVEPLLALFRKHHASTIEGGVAEWAYAIFRKLFEELSKRGLAVLRYAVRDNTIEAGALFVCEGNRIIYLFNAASQVGRRGNARTLLIDALIQEKAEQPILFDFESPVKQPIRDFYQSFGATEMLFYTLRWNRLNLAEKALLRIMRNFAVMSGSQTRHELLTRSVGFENPTSRRETAYLRKILKVVLSRRCFSNPLPLTLQKNQLRL